MERNNLKYNFFGGKFEDRKILIFRYSLGTILKKITIICLHNIPSNQILILNKFYNKAVYILTIFSRKMFRKKMILFISIQNALKKSQSEL